MSDLDRAYRRAVYRLELPAGPIDLAIGRPSAPLARLLREHRARSAAFLTAWNPGSVLTDPEVNRAAQTALVESAARLGHPTLPGVAVDPDGTWPDEESVLVLGIDLAAARDLAGRFGQNALVWIGADAIPTLVWVNGRDAP
ncbi:MAG TPA: DUF3293 domain-containing protein [Pseudomonadales bacterium]